MIDQQNQAEIAAQQRFNQQQQLLQQQQQQRLQQQQQLALKQRKASVAGDLIQAGAQAEGAKISSTQQDDGEIEYYFDVYGDGMFATPEQAGMFARPGNLSDRINNGQNMYNEGGMVNNGYNELDDIIAFLGRK